MSKETLNPPHGGQLVERLAPEGERKALAEKAKKLVQIAMDERTENDIEMLAIGGFSPLEGFLDRREYESVVDVMRLTSGTPWPIPLTLMVSEEKAKEIQKKDEVALMGRDGAIKAILSVEETFRPDKEREAKSVYRTDDAAHPSVGYLRQSGPVYVGGKVTVIEPASHSDFLQYRLPPRKIREIFQQKGWKRIVAFQTRNPIHRAHEYLTKCALENCDGLFIHPIVGATKEGDIPAPVRMKCYEVLIEKYYPKDRVLLGVNPAAMRYAGPREAILHAIVRKNYGCSHFIVGRDHAGVGNYYGTYDAQKLFDEFAPGELGIDTLRYENTFFCRSCGGMASTKTCPHPATDQVALSGTKVRELLSKGDIPPVEFSRPEVAKELMAAYRS
ncbi:MAG: sulfate adenylyltransferase [Bdellovibrionota bacterium]